ncbi:2,3-bisphosphoglycerate-independent phosphoglycerate mutase [Candidatus Woesearchaeota archaeon]|nr:2,3-bisphosphoglycerate-independent phosphoglycerate mutase [Candidatus Woesearchaeota archaeon]
MIRKHCPLILVVRDGYGINRRKEGNAVKLAKTPNTDFLMKNYPFTEICPVGECVGLPKGFQGSSEVGHLNMGAGRIVLQNLVRINKDIGSGRFFKNATLNNAFDFANKNNSYVHLMGLVQDEGVHAHQAHLYALLKLAKLRKHMKIYIHFFADGRDTPPQSAERYLKSLETQIKRYKTGKIVTLMGRYYSMDRDNRWDRTRLAFDAIAFGKGRKVKSPKQAISTAYKLNQSDEFIKPCIIEDYPGVRENEVLIFFNYRTDRPRQLTKALVETNFSKFDTRHPKIRMVCLTEYYKGMPADAVYKERKIKNNLVQVLSSHNIKQLRISETEKYAHVTFFFNSEIEQPYPGEDRILIPSPNVATYDLQPEMSAYKITERLLDQIEKDKYDFILLNLVNGDMVGHTGVLNAAIKGVEAVDNCIGKIHNAIMVKNGTMLVTADHGNCECMIDYKTGKPLTAHTTNNVYFIMVSEDKKLKKSKLRKGVLGDIAPTVLEIMNIKKPKEMAGKSLLT